MTKDFAADTIQLKAVKILQGTVVPSAGGGLAAPIGSKVLPRRLNIWDYTKTGAADTAWTLASADIYFNVANYGATGDGVTDDRAAIQEAIDDAAVLGGTVFFPYGTYLCALNGANPAVFDLAGLSNIRFAGSGTSSILKISGNCGGIARHLFSLSTSSSIEFQDLALSQAGLTNVVANACHLIDISSDADITKIIDCQFLGGVANGGAYVHIAGTSGHTATNAWISQCEMTLCGSQPIWIDGYTSRVWIEDSVIDQTGAGTNDTVLLSETNGGAIADVKIYGNEITNDTLYALRAVAASGQLITRLQVSDVNLFYGFVSLGQMNQCQFATNEVYASVAGIGDAVVAIEGLNTQIQLIGNIIARASTCTAGECLTVTPGAATKVTTRLQVQANRWVQETTFTVAHLIDVKDVELASNGMHVDNAGATANSAYIIEATVDGSDNILIADQITATAGTWQFGVQYLVNGANVGVNSIAGGQITACDVGVRWDSSGGGTFTSSQCMYTSNAVVATTSNWTSSATLYPRVGGNAGTFGVNIIEGTGTPEGNVTARIGSIYMRLDGGAGTSMYIKESGTGAAGWVGK